MAYPILVTVAIIKNKEGKYLLTQRPENVHNAERWEFPGGKLDFAEDPRDCLKREIKEELGINIEAKEILEYSSHIYGKEKHIVLLGFICNYLSGKIEKLHIKDYVWASPKEMKNYDITEADLPFLSKLK